MSLALLASLRVPKARATERPEPYLDRMLFDSLDLSPSPCNLDRSQNYAGGRTKPI